MKILSIVLFVALAAVAVADLPVHCLYPTTKGDWDFHLTEQTLDKTTAASTCSYKKDITSFAKTYRVSLQVPNIAQDQAGNKGTWTLIYDQGFEVIIGGNRYFAFFNYTATNSQVVSHCDKTLVGSFHEDGVDAKKWGCYKATKVASDESYVHKYEIPPPSNGIFINDMETISKINAVQSLWKAAPYMPFEGLPRSELLKKTGGAVPSFKIHAKNAHIAAMRPYAPVKAVNDLPNAYDWRNVEGKNYVSPVRNQQSCGSCYIFGTEGMFEARIRVASKNATQSIYSPQEVVSCDSLYSQGCNGGFPYLIEKYAQDFGIVEESCYPYHGSDSSCKPTTCKRQYFTNYGYVGGYYGASTEQGMMEEIYKNGPIVVNFEVLSDFYYYRSGIYKHTKLGNDPEPFVTVNHSVLIVGWGEQAGTKYWIVKNSWGSGWGMNGYFWIIRGIDNVGIESLTSAAVPVL